MKKIWLIGLLCLFLLVSVPTVEAGWWEDTVEWVMDLFGFETEEEIPESLLQITPTTLRMCDDNGRCTLKIHAGIRYIYEDEVWKKTEEARSFKGSGIKCAVNSDGENIAECIDWNETSKTIKFSTTNNLDTPREIPLKKFRINNSGDKIYDTKFETTVPLDNINEDRTLILKSNPNDYIEYGQHSTTIRLNTTADNMDDGEANSGDSDRSNGVSETLYINENVPANGRRIYIKWNTSLIPLGQTIEEVNLSLYSDGGAGKLNISTYLVYDHVWLEGPSLDARSYPDLTWDSQPCGTTWNNASSCNLTKDYTVLNVDVTVRAWTNFTVTNSFKVNYSDGTFNFSIALRGDNEGATTNWVDYSSKEDADGNKHPILNVVYSAPPVQLPPVVNNSFPKNSTQDYPRYINFTYNTTDPNGDNIDNCSLWLKHSYAGDWEENKTDSSITPIINQTLNITLPIENIYWKVGCYDDTSRQGNSSAFNYTRLITSPAVNNTFPPNSTQDYTPYVNFTYNTSILIGDIDSCNLWIKHSYAGDWELNATDYSITPIINQTFNLTLPFENIYWKVECNSTMGENTNSSEFNYTRIIPYPRIYNVFPDNQSTTTTRYMNLTYNFTVPYGNIDSCWLWLNETLNATDYSITPIINQTFNLTLFPAHRWTWKIECNSSDGYYGNSTTWEFILNNAPTTPPTLDPTNNSIIYTTSINISCSGSTDAENDTIYYEFYGSNGSTGNFHLMQNSTSTTYTWTPISENNYYWLCRVNDNRDHSGNSSIRRIISLGSGTFNVSMNTTCEGGLTAAMCWDYKDEENYTLLTTNIDYNFEILLANLSVLELYGEHDNVNDTCFCVNSTLYNNYTLEYGEIQYEKLGYVDRRYYAFSNTRLTGTQINDTLFHLLNGKSTSFLFEFANTALVPYVEKYISLLRWYPDLDTYDTVDMGRTDEKGQTIMKVVVEDVDYRVGLYHKNGSLIKLLEPIRFACLASPCSYVSIIEEVEVKYTEFLEIESYLNWDATTQIFTYTYNDPSQNTQEMELKVYRQTGTSDLELCTDTATGYTGVLTCDMSAYSSGTLRAIAYRTASPEVPIIQRLVNIRNTVFKGDVGLFLSFFLFLALVLIGAAFGVIPAMIVAIIALIPAYVLGSITLSVVIGLGTLIGIVIHFMKRTQR